MSFIPSPTLATDFYKEVHHGQYNPNMTKLVSYLTPRMSRVAEKDLVFFGLQYFIKDFLMGTFSDKFFKLPKEKAVGKYVRMMKFTMGDTFADPTRWEKLWDLGYLPLRIKAVAEGKRVPMGCPCIEITNTHPDFVWLVNYIETAMSCTLWHTMASANVGAKYRQIVNKYYNDTVEDSVPHSTAIGDFSMRGQESIESATKSSAAFLLSFRNTATIPAIEFLEEYYKCDVEKEIVGKGLASTEHSVMCSNTAIDGNEHDFVIKLLNIIYPHDNFTMVSDSYDYWNMLSNILSMDDVKEAVLNHKGFIGIRGDSGDPVEILCGKSCHIFKTIEECKEQMGITHFTSNNTAYIDGAFYHLVCLNPNEKIPYKWDCIPIEVTSEFKGTVETLWDIFGGTINSKGYKVLDPHVKAVYGDSITPERAEQIYYILKQKGFAANNVSLGMGSYSLQSAENNSPLTRDTYSIAVKSTYGEYRDSDGTIKPLMIFKNPKTDSGHFKKSQKGCCVVTDNKGVLTYQDGYTFEQADSSVNALQTVLENGILVKDYSLAEIRATLNDGNFD